MCALWFLEDGDFCAAERVGDFSSRPDTLDAIVHSRLQHHAQPDGVYENERWHVIIKEDERGELFCLAAARSFVRQCVVGTEPLSVLALLAVVTHPSARRHGYGRAVVSSVFERLANPDTGAHDACLFAVAVRTKPHLETFYRGMPAT